MHLSSHHDSDSATYLVHQVWATQTVNRSAMGALAFLVWDICITLDDEVTYIWSKSWSRWSKWMFLFVRYFALFAQISLHTFHSSQLSLPSSLCRASFIWQAIQVPVIMTAVEVILVVRVHVLYNRSRMITNILLAFFLAELIAMAVSIMLTIPHLQFDTISGCYVTEMPVTIFIYGAAGWAFETFLFGLTLVKFFRSAQQAKWSYTPVITSITRDGTWAFALIFVALLTNAITYGAINNVLSGVGFTWLLSVLSFAGCRLMLNMQRLAAPYSAEDDDTTLEFLTSSVPEADLDSRTPPLVSSSAVTVPQITVTELDAADRGTPVLQALP